MSGLLKFITCGSVDDGKSTLIGHILYDSKLLYADQEKALILDSKVGSRGGAIDYSLLLDGLKERNVRVSFFLLGEKVEQYPELVERMQKEGHLVGNHTYHHVQLNKLNETKAREEILKTNNLIYETTGVYPLYLRPPFGAWKKNLELCVEMLPVFWTIDTLDWKVKNTEKIVRTVKEQIEDGAIILMHDEYDTSVEAALQVVDELKNQGYELVTVDQLILP